MFKLLPLERELWKLVTYSALLDRTIICCSGDYDCIRSENWCLCCIMGLKCFQGCDTPKLKSLCLSFVLNVMLITSTFNFVWLAIFGNPIDDYVFFSSSFFLVFYSYMPNGLLSLKFVYCWLDLSERALKRLLFSLYHFVSFYFCGFIFIDVFFLFRWGASRLNLHTLFLSHSWCWWKWSFAGT